MTYRKIPAPGGGAGFGEDHRIEPALRPPWSSRVEDIRRDRSPVGWESAGVSVSMDPAPRGRALDNVFVEGHRPPAKSRWGCPPYANKTWEAYYSSATRGLRRDCGGSLEVRGGLSVLFRGLAGVWRSLVSGLTNWFRFYNHERIVTIPRGSATSFAFGTFAESWPATGS